MYSFSLRSFLLTLLSLGLLSTSSPGNAIAGEPSHLGEKSFWSNALGKLDLSADQRKSLEELREVALVDRKKAHKEIGELRRSLREKLNATATEEELRALYAEIEKRAAETHRNKFERMLKVRSILTPAQRQELMKLDAGKHDKKVEPCEHEG